MFVSVLVSVSASLSVCVFVYVRASGPAFARACARASLHVCI